ncbi:MAG: DUF262 domain-containing HNH endonuclease family protein [Pseudomonadota bacterium]
MTIDIENAFKATAKSTSDFLMTNGQGCYIPAYQREYSWDRENIDRLFEDARNGVVMVLKRPETISFLGTVIAIHDIKHQTVKPIYHSEMPSKVMTIIDGQQRISTFMMANVALHDTVRRAHTRFAKKSDTHFAWISDQAQQLLALLEDTVILDMKTGDEDYRYYPRLIRSYLDVWSKRQGQGEYTSPVAHLIWSYFQHEKSQSKAFKAEAPSEGLEDIARFNRVQSVYTHITRRLKKIAALNPPGEENFDILGCVASSDFAEAIFGYPFPDEVVTYVTTQAEDADTLHKAYCELLSTIVFARYLNERMAFTVVTTKSEDDAFDMFEALNTTGEPLTAFETFKPKVIDAESIEKYEHSPSYEEVGRIERYLDQFKDASKKQKATSEMLIPFALAENGEQLEKKLNAQRKYLRREFEFTEIKDSLKSQRAFVRRLAHTAEFLADAWDAPVGTPPSFTSLRINDPDVVLCLQLLKDMKHSIIIAPICRFFGQALDAADDAEKAKRSASFVSAIKATAAFSILWRGAFGSTGNIESKYREIMREGVGSVPPLSARPPGDKTGIVSYANYLRALKALLEEKKLLEKNDWVKSAARQPIYSKSRPVSRFLLILASDDAEVDNNTPGLIVRGRRDLFPMVSYDVWMGDAAFEVEHIAPQTRNDGLSGWDAAIYEDPDTVHQLGNLTLLPSLPNKVASDRPWAQKRLIYRALSAETEDVFTDTLKQISKEDAKFSERAAEILSGSGYLRMTRALCERSENWTAEFIAQRSERLAGLAWDRLQPWLISASL